MPSILCLGGPEDGNLHIPNLGPNLLRVIDRSKLPSIYDPLPLPSETVSLPATVVYHLMDIRFRDRVWDFWVLPDEIKNPEDLITRLIDGYRKPR